MVLSLQLWLTTKNKIAKNSENDTVGRPKLNIKKRKKGRKKKTERQMIKKKEGKKNERRGKRKMEQKLP